MPVVRGAARQRVGGLELVGLEVRPTDPGEMMHVMQPKNIKDARDLSTAVQDLGSEGEELEGGARH